MDKKQIKPIDKIDMLEADVLVVGAGAAGLMAARLLNRSGYDVQVLEARDRVGGRTWSDHIEGAFLELGGQWISPDHTELLGLLEELGLETYQCHREGESVYLAEDGTRHCYAGGNLPLPEPTQAEVSRLIRLIDELAVQLGAEQPWAHPSARELDTVSFATWLRAQSDDEQACRLVSMFIDGALLTKPAHTFSALQAVHVAAAAGSFSNLVDDDFILNRRVVGGMQLVSEVLAGQLDRSVILDAPVRSLRWEGADGWVVADAGRDPLSPCYRVRARRAVVAVPPPLYGQISYQPPLPARHQQLHQHLSMGLVLKVHAVYDRPFWREQGLSGTGFGVGQVVREVYDNTNYGDTRGTLVGFVTDEQADRVLALSATERKEQILASLARYLGPEAQQPEVYVESDWASEEWTRGGYAASFDLGGLSRYGAYHRASVGPIHWACSELAAEGFQDVDGALRRGRQVAETIAAELGAPSAG